MCTVHTCITVQNAGYSAWKLIETNVVLSNCTYFALASLGNGNALLYGEWDGNYLNDAYIFTITIIN